MYRDDSGEWIHIAIGALVGFAFGGVVSAVTQYFEEGKISWGTVLVSAGGGALSGALAATGVGLVGQAIGNAAISVVTDVGTMVIEGEINTANIVDLMETAAIGALCGLAGGPGGSTRHLSSAANNLFSKTGKIIQSSVKRSNFDNTAKDIINAFKYYYKNAAKEEGRIVKSVLKSFLPLIGIEIGDAFD